MLFGPLLRLCLLSSVAPISGLWAGQVVHVVDSNNSPGTDFLAIAPALAASAASDVILVRPGDYRFEDLLIDGRGALLQGELGAEIRISKLQIKNLPAGEVVALRNLTLGGGGVSSISALDIRDCLGSIWIEDVYVSGLPNAFFAGAVRVADSAQVVLIRCQVDPPFNLGTGHSFEIDNAQVHLFECNVDGLAGGGFPFFSLPGEIALRMTDGELFLNGSTLNGGTGGQGVGMGGMGSIGGAALVMLGNSPSVHVLDSALNGGAGGVGALGGMDGAMGPSIVQGAPGASVIQEQGMMRHFEVCSPVRENAVLRIEGSGFLGDRVWLSTPGAPGPTRTSSKWNGASVTPLLPLQFLGTWPADGPLSMNVPLGALPAGVDFGVVFAQAYFKDTRFTVSSPSMVLVLDESF